MKFTPSKLALALALAMGVTSTISTTAEAAGLGRLNVQSALGQPLRAEVEITSLSKEEENGLNAKVASQEAFKQAGMEFNPALLGIRLAVEKRADGKQVVKLTSNRPVNEPFLDVLLELNWASGRLIREYTVLLDPPELKLSRAESISAPTISNVQVARPVQAASPASPTFTPAPAAPIAQDTVQVTANAEPLPNPVAQRKAEARARAEEQQRIRDEARIQALADAQAKADAKAQAKADAKAQAQADAQARADARAEVARNKAEAREQARAQAQDAKVAKANKAPAAAAEAVATEGTYQVKRGDTLAKIARTVGPQGVTLDQALVSLYRANESAFDGRNMNRLRAGQILSLPTADAASEISNKEARQVVVAQTADFAAYREKLAGAVGAAPAKPQTEAGQAAGGKITAKVEEKAVTKDAADKLKLSAAGKEAGKDKGTGAGVAAEQAVAKKKALEETQSRSKELEKNVADLQNAVKLKNEQMAKLEAQKKADAEAKAKADAERARVEAEVKAKAEADAAAAKAKAEADAKAKADAEQKAKEADAKAKADAEAAKAQADAAAKAQADAAKAQAQAAAEKPAEKAPEAAAPAPVAPPVSPAPAPVAPAPAPEAAPEQTVSAGLFGSPLALGGLGLIGLLGAGYAAYSVMRRKKFQQFEDSIITGTNLQANSVFGQTGGQSVDTNSMFNSTFGPVTTSALDSNEVDPIAEADVYIAYGRQAQAEEILKEALRRDGDRQAVRLKLIELCAQRGDAKAVETLAGEMYAMTNGDCEEWPRVLAVGAAVDPSNPMYANAGAAIEPNHESTMPVVGAGAAAVAATGAMIASTLDPAETVKLPNGGAMLTDTQDMADFPLDMADTQPAPVDFDLDLTKQFAEPAANAAASSAADLALDLPMPEPIVAADANTLDFDIGFDTPSAASEPTFDLPLETAAENVQAVHQEVVAQSEQASGLDFDLGDLEVPSLADHARAGAEAAELNIDLPALQPLAESALDSAYDAPPALDVAGLDLDLPAPQESAASNDAEVDGDAPSHWQEIATKLDLAKAYLDIGDKEGAQELLEEVVDAGDAAQKAKAQAMLADIA